MFKRRPLGGSGSSSGNNGDGNSAAGSRTGASASSGAGSSNENSGGNSAPQNVRPQQQGPRGPSAQGPRPDGSGRRRNRRRGRGRGGPNAGPGGGTGGQPQASGQTPNPGAANPQRTQRPGGPRQGGGRPPGQNDRQNERSPSGRNQQNQGPRNQHRHQQSQGPRQPVRRPPPPPPAYLQRGLVLVVAPDHTQAIDAVRTKFDPLVKKIPAHVTLVLPEPASLIQNSFLRTLTYDGLPQLENLTFTHVEVKDERYLFLVPDEDSKGRLRQWREMVMGALNEDHTQDEEYAPRLTLGYIPRSMTPDDAVAFARNLITFPLSLPFEKLMLEEFEENQLSKQIDALKMNEPFPERPTEQALAKAKAEKSSGETLPDRETGTTDAGAAEAVTSSATTAAKAQSAPENDEPNENEDQAPVVALTEDS